MKFFLSIIKNKWFIGIIGVSALSLFIWIIGDYVKFGESNASLSNLQRLMAIGLIWLIWLTWMIANTIFEHKQNKALFKNIEEQSQDGLSPTDEKSKLEILELNARFQEALQKLAYKRSFFSNNVRNLYQLPWYIIIGPPGSGKTTALVNSGLEFPLLETTGSHTLKGIGGTRNCDWWFTNEAVLIDTAGRFTTQDSHKVVDHSSWTTFLDLLKKFRSRRPINGIILAASIQDLLLSSPEQRQLQAKTLRTRIDEIQQRLGINAPVYLILTKADLIAGFSEFFNGLSRTERNQVWGVTLTPNTEQPANLFTHEFNFLIKRLQQQVVDLVNAERVVTRKSKIQNFPQRISELSETLNDFIHQTFAANRFGTTPLLRGVYFTSGTQEGAPIDRMINHMSSAFNISVPMQAQENTGKSFFVYTLFKQVIFPEAELVGSNARIESFIRWGRRGVMLTILTAIIGSGFIWAAAIKKNNALLADVRESLDTHKKTEKDAPYKPEALLATLNALQKASTIYNKSEQTYLTSLGLYTAEVDDAADKLYQTKLNTLLLPEFTKQLKQQLSQMQADDPNLLTTLKVYLMMFNPEHQDNKTILNYAQNITVNNLALNDDQLTEWFTHFEQLLSQPLFGKMKYDEQLVNTSRQKALQIPPASRLYDAIKNSSQFNKIVDLYRPIGGDSQLLFGISNQDAIYKMPASFMKAGFDKLDLSVDSPLIAEYFNEQWILGEDQTTYSKQQKMDISNQLERLYLTDYAEQWHHFISGLNLSKSSNLNQLSDQLNQLSNPATSPFKGIISIANENTKFSQLLEGGADENVKVGMTGTKPKVSTAQVLKSVKSKIAGAWNDRQELNLVEKQFIELHALSVKSDKGPSPIEDYLSVLSELNTFLLTISTSPQPDKAAYEAAQKRFAGQTDDPIKKLQLKAKYAPRPLSDWLTQISDNAWELLVSYSGRHLNQTWTYQVLPECQRIINNRFPFSPNSDVDVNTQDFNEFFSAKGAMQVFFDEYLSQSIDPRQWSVKSVDGRSFPISSSALEQFKRISKIQRAFFSSGNVASTQLAVVPSKLSSQVRLFTLEVGGAPISYSHGPRTPKNLQWTLGETSRARILFEDLDEGIHQKQYDGDWAWYRLVYAMKNTAGARAGTHKITFTQSGFDSTYEFISNSSEDPLNLSLFTQFRCPTSL